MKRNVEYSPRRYSVVLFIVLAASSLLIAIRVGGNILLIYYFGWNRVWRDGLRILAMPKGQPWPLSDGKQLGHGFFLHYLISLFIWFAIFIPAYFGIYFFLPRVPPVIVDESDDAKADLVLLKSRWNDLCAKLRVTENVDALFDELCSIYQQPHRAYHNLYHIQSCLTEFYMSGFKENQAIELALWFHDAVYDPQRHDNEEASAELVASRFAFIEIPDFIPSVHRLIMATKHTTVPILADERAVADIDLSILGRPWEEFVIYEATIRKEYEHVPDADFKKGRAAILESFLKRTRIYQTVYFYARYEQQARQNLAESLRQLKTRQNEGVV